jgi:hypothetical protein
MNFKQHYNKKQDQWVLFAEMFDKDKDLCICKLKQYKDLTKEERALIKKSKDTNYTLNALQKRAGIIQSWEYFPPGRMSTSRTEILIGPKEALDEEMELYKVTYPGFKQVMSLNVDPETKQSWEDIANEL